MNANFWRSFLHFLNLLSLQPITVQARSGAIRRSSASHLATVLLRPPSGHQPGRRQGAHARILQVGLHLTQPWSVWTPPSAWFSPSDLDKKNPVGGILRRESRHKPRGVVGSRTMLDLFQANLPEYQIIRHIVILSVTKDTAKRHSTKGFQLPS